MFTTLVKLLLLGTLVIQQPRSTTEILTDIETLIKEWKTPIPPPVESTFGKATIGATYNNFPAANAIATSLFTMPSSGTVSRLSIYFKGTSTSPDHEAGPAKGAIYASTAGEPGALVATTVEVIVPDNEDGWVDFVFTPGVPLVAGDYYLGINASTRKVGAMDTTGTNRNGADTYSDGPANPFPTSTISTLQKSIYATYVSSGEPPPPPPPGNAIVVQPGTGLQAALNAAPDGALIHLVAGGVYTGGVKIKKPVTIETGGITLPANQRVTLADASNFARVTTSMNLPAWDITASNVTIRKVSAYGAVGDLVLAGHGDASQTTLALQPENVTLDQVLLEGDVTNGLKRAVGLHAKNVTVKNSYIHQVFWVTDSSAIGGWNGTGPFNIVNNFISGGVETILIGGADPSIPGATPADILIEGNTLTFPLGWKGVKTRKNVVEFKTGKRITIQNNIIENSWTSGQVGWCLVITPSQYGGYPQATVEDLIFRQNIVRHCGGFASILGHGQNQSVRPTQTSARLAFSDNYIYDLDVALGDHGGLMILGNGPIDVSWTHNTISMNGNAFIRTSNDAPVPGFSFTGNLVNNIEPVDGQYYGLFLNGQYRGNELATRMPGAVFTGNAFVKVHATFKTNLPSNTWLATAADATYNQLTGIATGALTAFGRRP